MKLCKDCKHSQPSIWERILRFMFPSLQPRDICKRYYDRRKETLCVNERMNLQDQYQNRIDTCGSDAKYYEARK